ncbi:hypothetical protein [Jhaorihella thermophila]|uniref:Uncharacterized protein n=1 Tax=Jhaorihella thermophila TaxID=488547 RepID=A0A1H5SN65_9RHOB|nr:hypothetical protein [Jhaorihella thermophila]SEF52063.1 hypothetical protein SAMN05421751_101643 [Jhaorihella thermophila]
MRRILIVPTVLAALATVAAADVVGPGGKVRDCYCTDSKGKRVELGQTICLFVDGRMFMAQCQMSLNNPMWRKVRDGCLSSRLRLQRLQPGLDAGAVHSEI